MTRLSCPEPNPSRSWHGVRVDTWRCAGPDVNATFLRMLTECMSMVDYLLPCYVAAGRGTHDMDNLMKLGRELQHVHVEPVVTNRSQWVNWHEAQSHLIQFSEG